MSVSKPTGNEFVLPVRHLAFELERQVSDTLLAQILVAFATILRRAWLLTFFGFGLFRICFKTYIYVGSYQYHRG